MAFSIVTAKVPAGDAPICGVTLEPYVHLKRADISQTAISADEIPEEGSGDGVHQLRSRWYRSTVSKGGCVCGIHPEKEATIQCLICVKLRVPQHLSYHCSPDCFRSNWHLHKDYHKQGHPNGGGENGFNSDVQKTVYHSNGETWIEVGRGRNYTPSSEDVGYVLRYEVSIVDTSRPYTDYGRCSAITARVRPQPTAPPRNVISLVGSVVQVAAGSKFTVLTYNLLADLYTKDFLQPELQKAGYTGIYKKKTSDVFTNTGSCMDGCATFFRRDRFSLVKKYEVEFNKAAQSLAEGIQDTTQKKNALNRLLKDNVALIAVLEALDGGAPDVPQRPQRQLLCVANTHIHANPELNDVKLWQVNTLLKGLEKIAASADIPMLVAGDFNSIPGSAAHQLLVSQKLDVTQMDSMDPLSLFAPNPKLSHSLPLSSVYTKVFEAPPGEPRLLKQKQRLDPTHHEPTFTNWTRDFKNTLDYIFYTHENLKPLAVLELPSENDLQSKPEEGLPNPFFSSDHIALMAEFQYLARN